MNLQGSSNKSEAPELQPQQNFTYGGSTNTARALSAKGGMVAKNKTAYLRPGQLAKFAHAQRVGTLPCLRAGMAGTGNMRGKAEEAPLSRRPPLPANNNVWLLPHSALVLGECVPCCVADGYFLIQVLKPSKTLNKIFSHGKGKKKVHRSGRQKDCPLLTLPQEVLARILCFLRHDELQPLYHVCTRLRDAVCGVTQRPSRSSFEQNKLGTC